MSEFNMAADKTRVITAHVAEEQARYEMTLEAIRSVEEGNFVRHEDILKWIHDANSAAKNSAKRKD